MASEALDGLRLVLRCKLARETRAAHVEALQARGARVTQRASSKTDAVFVDDGAARPGALAAHTRVFSAAQLRALVRGAAWAHLMALEGETLVLVGAFEPLGKAALSDALRGRGAHVASGVSSKTSALLVGALVGGRPERNASVLRARQHSVPVLGEDALGLLLGGATLAQALEAQPKPAPPEPVAPNEALASLRALIHQRPSAQVWDAICAELDGCDESALEVALDYVEAGTASWPERLYEACMVEPYPEYKPAAGDELREVPERWLSGLFAGQDHPKLRAAQALVCMSKRLTNAVGVRLLQCASLSHVRGLYVANNRLSKKFCAQLAASAELLPALELLDLTHNPLRGAGFKALSRAPLWQRLRTVSLRETGLDDTAGPSFAALRAPELRTLILRSNALGEQAMRGLARAELPALERLDLYDNIVLDDAVEALVGGAWPNLRALDIRGGRLGHRGLVALMDATSMPRLETLRASTFFQTPPDWSVVEAPRVETRWEHLRVLDLSVGMLSDAGFERLTARCAPEAMRVLLLSHTALSARTAAALPTRFPNLATLELSGCALDAAFVEGLLERAEVSALKTLVLDHNVLKTEDILRLLRAPALRALEVLNVNYNDLDDLDALLVMLAREGRNLPALRAVHAYTDQPLRADQGVRMMLTAPGLEQLRHVGIAFDDEVLDPELRHRFYERFEG